MQNLSLGAGSLIRNQSIEIRVSHREHALKQFKVGPNRVLSGKEIVLMIEWVENGYWRNKSLVAQPTFEVARLINCSFFRKNHNEALNFCTAKGQKMLTPGMKIGEIHEKYHDIDDNILYLRVIRENSFG